ncbi:MAG TPA: LuxR C-terminal-related transcriptional regulator [Polyangiaceae bacterium]|nr:LuxR C-terminal-related transcriptional regulator [Polyangiaceae bacterium]
MAPVSLLGTPAAIDVVSRIYSAALDGSQWQATIAALTAWIGGEIGCLQLRCLGPQPLVRLVHCGVQPGVEQAYQQYYQYIDPHLTRVAQLPRGRTVLSREVVDDEEFFSSEFYNDFFRPQGICDLQGAMLIRDSSHVVTFATQSALHHRYDAETRARMDAIVPHLTRALEFVVRAEALGGEQSALLAASEGRHSGLLRVNAELAILEASAQTLSWLSQAGGALAARDGRLLAQDDQDAERLRLCVRSALAQATARCELCGSASESLVLVASPAAPSLLFPEPSAFLVFSTQPRARCAAGTVESLPPALRPVAELLRLGLSDKDIADRLQLPLATARTYVSRTLRRLRVRSRRELLVRR